MNKEAALQILRQVCAIYKGTLEEHQKLQEALQVLEAKDEQNTVEEDSPKK